MVDVVATVTGGPPRQLGLLLVSVEMNSINYMAVEMEMPMSVAPRSGREDLGVLVDVVGAWAYATWYGPPLTCPLPLASYSTPSRPGGRAPRPLTSSTP